MTLLARPALVLAMVLATTGASGRAFAEQAAPDPPGPAGAAPPRGSTGAGAAAEAPAASANETAMRVFLDRLMAAESGGRDDVANPRSTAVGAYQFIVSTFLDVTRRHFAAETKDLQPEQILALRRNRAFARKAAEAYTRDNAQALAAADVATSWPNLRLAFLLGAEGAIRVLRQPPATPLRAILGRAVIDANPFMANMTTGDLIARAARDVSLTPSTTAGLTVSASPDQAEAAVKRRQIRDIRCSLTRASCRRWLALAERRILKAAGTWHRAVAR